MSEEPVKPKSRWRMAVEATVVVLIITTIIGLLSPNIIVCPKNRDRSEAVSNAKCLGLAFYTFQDDYGSLPSEDTVRMVKDKHPNSTAKLGNTTSNDFFRQLIASGVINQEKPFFARTSNCRRPDNVMTGEKLLEKGEVGFAYVVSHASDKEGNFPIAFTPLVKGKLLFDYEGAKKYFGGNKVVVLWTDCSVTIETVNKDGRVILNGKDFFDPSQPYWHGIAPKVAWPE